MNLTNLNFTSRVLLTSMPDVFSCRGAKQGWARVPASASLRAWAGGPVQAYRTSIFLGVKLLFVSIMNFGQIQKVRFIIAKIFQSNSYQLLVILIWSNELASFGLEFKIFCSYCFAQQSLERILNIQHFSNFPKQSKLPVHKTGLFNG